MILSWANKSSDFDELIIEFYRCTVIYFFLFHAVACHSFSTCHYKGAFLSSWVVNLIQTPVPLIWWGNGFPTHLIHISLPKALFFFCFSPVVLSKGLNNRHHNIHAIWVESRTESNGLDGDTCCDDWSRLTLIKMDPSSQQVLFLKFSLFRRMWICLSPRDVGCRLFILFFFRGGDNDFRCFERGLATWWNSGWAEPQPGPCIWNHITETGVSVGCSRSRLSIIHQRAWTDFPARCTCGPLLRLRTTCAHSRQQHTKSSASMVPKKGAKWQNAKTISVEKGELVIKGWQNKEESNWFGAAMHSVAVHHMFPCRKDLLPWRVLIQCKM